MPNAQDLLATGNHKLLVVGQTGSGKTALIRSLPGRKFVYVFDPGALATLRGADIEYECFFPDILELDATLKGFNKNARPDDKPPSEREPQAYMLWVEHLNKAAEEGLFKDFDWVCFDSLTLLSKSVMDRQLWINKRYGGIEDLGDYRVVGSKVSEVFRSITAIGSNIYCTGHISSFQDEKTKKLEVSLTLPGSAKQMLPLLFTNIWLAKTRDGDKGPEWILRTRPEERGLQTIRTSIPGLETEEDVTIKDFSRAEQYGIGAILKQASTQQPVVATRK